MSDDDLRRLVDTAAAFLDACRLLNELSDPAAGDWDAYDEAFGELCDALGQPVAFCAVDLESAAQVVLRFAGLAGEVDRARNIAVALEAENEQLTTELAAARVIAGVPVPAERWPDKGLPETPSRLYLLVCRQCEAAAGFEPVPFPTAEDRARWALAHQDQTAHFVWWSYEEDR